MDRRVLSGSKLRLAALSLVAAAQALAGSSVTTSLITHQGAREAVTSGDYVTATGGMDSLARYWIEVPSGLARLRVDIFDPDIGLGGDPEVVAQRDRVRGNWDTAAVYGLFSPTGAQCPVRFTTGNATTPAASDGQWVSFFDNGTYVDNFGTAAYTNQNGTLNWTSDWTETSDDNTAGGGDILITGGTLRLRNTNGNSIQREANLGCYTAATLTFSTATTGLDNGDQYRIEVSNNGGTSWTTLQTVTLPATPTGSYDISAFLATNTRIRFSSVSGFQNGEFVNFDNVTITATGAVNGHYELRVDMTDAVNTNANQGDDINAFGIRASDGDTTGGGTELPVYYYSHTGVGVNPPATGTGTNTRSYTYFPYITSGCTASQKNFDWDSQIAGSQGTLDLTSRTTSFSQSFGDAQMAPDNTWLSAANGTIQRWTSDTNSTDYGIWQMDVDITSYVLNGGQNGNYGNLFFTNYAFVDANPTANPTTNTFRVYFPTDAGGTPVKPYVEQWRNYTSGPNPVATTGTTPTIFTVSIKVTNPTAKAITFSGANLLTANVPGSGVTYDQGAAPAPVAQPGAGGTGSITWNLGTIAAGGSSTVTYRVRVAPAAANTRRVMTGVPGGAGATAGTTAQYLDETGAATYVFGPLCELAVNTSASITPVVISHLETRETSGGVAVRWETASEVDAIGFDVYRWEPSTSKWLKINDRLVPALVGSPQGGRYEVLDRGASASTKYWYSIRETESDGKGRSYGPFQAERASASGVAATGLEAARPKRPTLALLKASASREAIAATGGWTLRRVGVAPALRVGVRNDAVVFLSREEIASHFGMSPAAASLLIATGRFNLTSHGARIAWTPASGARGLLFYGQAIDSPYSRDNVYWLRSGAGLMVDSVTAPAPAAVRGATFVDTIHAELDTFAATLVSTKPDSDYWYWDGLIAGDPTLGKKTFTVTAPHAVASGSPSLLVTLASANTSGVANEHHVVVRLNGTPIGETTWAGIKTQQVRLPFGAGLLQDGANTVELEAALGAGVPVSFVYLDSFDLTYSRDFTAANSALKFTSNKARNVTVTGFADAGVMVLDVSNPRVPRRIKNVAVSDADGGFRASFVPSSAQALYVATSETGWQAPAWTEGDQPSSLKTSTGAEYVVVTTADLMDAAERLASLHASTMSTMVVDITNIYDEFSDGLVDPRALDAFVKQAARWSMPARYVVIAGRGNFDYKNIYGLGGNLVPPAMVSTPKGLFASDTSLGDVNGDGVPEVAVGRIPVLSSDELDAYVDKVRAYESALTPETARQALMLADAPDNGTDFSVASDQIAAGVPSGYEADRIYLQTGGDITVPRDELFARLASGADLVNYTGHGALDRLSGEGLLTSDDVPALDNVQTPVLTALSCTINRFEVPGFAPLGEQVVKKAGGGFVASWAPTGLSDHEQATLLGKAFYRDLGVHPNAPLGDAVNRAFKSYMSLGGVAWMPAIYSLIGDPALTLKEGVAVEDPGTGTATPSTE